MFRIISVVFFLLSSVLSNKYTIHKYKFHFHNINLFDQYVEVETNENQPSFLRVSKDKYGRPPSGPPDKEKNYSNFLLIVSGILSVLSQDVANQQLPF